MNNSQFDRVLRILARTGDRCMVFDRQNDQGVMVMSLDEYEKMLDGGAPVSELSEGDMLDKINRDIAVWREKHQSEADKTSDFDWDFSGNDTAVAEPKDVVEHDFYDELPETEKPLDLAEKEDEIELKSPANEVDLSGVPSDGEEEKFYLELVE